MIYQIPVDQITGLAKYGLALSCTAVSDLAESDLARYAPPVQRSDYAKRSLISWHRVSFVCGVELFGAETRRGAKEQGGHAPCGLLKSLVIK